MSIINSHVSKNAIIHPSVEIGPFCYIGDNVKIGKNCVLKSHVSISGNTNIGNDNIFYPFSSIGSAPQDLKFENEKSYLIIGDKNTFRENVTVNPGTLGGGLKTLIKNNCLFMVGSHIAHDCKIESNVILANNATLAGHVEIGENAIIGGNSAIHQFVQIGKNSMVGGMSGVEKNILPYCLYIGIRTGLKGLNLIGLKRNNISNKTIKLISSFLLDIFDKKNSIEINLLNLDKKYKKILEIEEMIQFLKKSNKRGIATLINE
ncbi:acyl-ACP--UDP-N-acetylglucosamine O-acyltransferase [Alphaproteobacteria bacterium]|jgi:UDP-N-acetylglucosamine acyltransferase|nr:acyl-ACP--UDP-N-acetylglucosamine O-acyltransferase [Alphaproteobacteria bacterium]MDC3270280.1 acyl-ACP--UDP-N-acetylglucosamine O-acyltransferase [Alphaproteobacteria bacterium]